MVDALKFPGDRSDGKPDWDSLYLYRGSSVLEARPVFTGDVFFDVEVHGVTGVASKNVLLIQHPCALRSNGVDLAETLVVVEVVPHDLYKQSQWGGNYRIMPLPELVEESSSPHHEAVFTSPYLITPTSLSLKKRVACMTPFGVNLLLQRWVYHNSRAAISTQRYDEATSAQYEEADCVEEWSGIRQGCGVTVVASAREAMTWLNDQAGSGVRRREMLENRQWRGRIRKEMRKYATSLNESSRLPH